MTVCWHPHGGIHAGCPNEDADHMLFVYGRCRSGQRWFWAAEPFGEMETLHGWALTEDEALSGARAAIERAMGGRPAIAYIRQSVAARVLKSVNAGKRRARPPSAAADARPVEYLYGPWSYWDDEGECRWGITEFSIVKKTPKRIYYDSTSRWDRMDDVVTLGFISREEFEADTRCHAGCPRDIPAGRVCARHGRGFRHCVHFGERDQDPRCWLLPGCGSECPMDTGGFQCAEHRYTWDHCPHGNAAGTCRFGTGPGEIRTSKFHEDAYHLFATREAAEENVFGAHRERERQRQEQEPELKRLRREMADAHPDRGGTNEGFIAARERYERALARVS